jgi:hypothetical protein
MKAKPITFEMTPRACEWFVTDEDREELAAHCVERAEALTNWRPGNNCWLVLEYEDAPMFEACMMYGEDGEYTLRIGEEAELRIPENCFWG